MDKYIGKLLDNRYEIQQMIGSGGMAVVYKALCHRLHRNVAVKILKDEFARDKEIRDRFHAESQAVAMVSHPNIVGVYDVSHSEGVDYIVMELVDGISLKEYMEQKGVLNWRESLHFATQICKALEHAHERGIIHRDIKPHNIMILKDGSIKVADFGIAQMGNAVQEKAGEAIGSVHYISPEQVRGGEIDARADLYSLGVVLYEMLTGVAPYDGKTPEAVAAQHLGGKALSVRLRNPAVPEGLEQITMHAMAAELDARYESAARMLQDLEAFRMNPTMIFGAEAEETAPAGKDSPAPAPVKKRKASAPVLVAAIACVCLLVTGMVWLLSYLMSDTFRRAEDVVVPDFYLMPLSQVQEQYGDTFLFEITERPAENGESAGLILSQKPKADMPVKKGATVAITVSAGTEEFSMPNLVNHSLTDAMDVLKSMDLRVREKQENSDIYVRNYIIRTEPAYGTALTPGQEVTLVVSLGSDIELVQMPDITGKPLAEALSVLEESGLSTGNVKYVKSDIPRDTVTFQSIAAQEYVRPETLINLEVSQGPQKTAQAPQVQMDNTPRVVTRNEPLELQVTASVTDGGTLTYQWFASRTGSMSSLQSVGAGPTLRVNTDTVGTVSYCCKVTNTLGESVASVNTSMVTVTVQPKLEPVTKTLQVTLPAEGSEKATLTVKLDGEEYTPSFTVDRSLLTADVTISSTGTRQVDIYVDGVLTLSRTVVFTS